MNALCTIAPRGCQPSQRIAVLHAGPVGLATAILLARRHRVVVFDAHPERAHTINAGCSPLDEPELTAHLQREALKLRATTCLEDAIEHADCVIVTTPTRYDPLFRSVNTRDLDDHLEAVHRLNPQALVVISSNLPVGYTDRSLAHAKDRVPIVAPVVLQPGNALHDRCHPKRLVMGERSIRAAKFAWMLRDCLGGRSLSVVFTDATEAEAIYLFEHKRLLQGGELSYSEVARYATRHGLDLGQLLEGLDLDGLPELTAHPSAIHWARLVVDAAVAA